MKMSSNKCFLDTSALIALNDARDQYHALSSEIAATLNGNKLIISDAVVNETYNILRYRLGFHKSRYFLQTVLAGHPFIIADITTPIRSSTFKILEQYRDHKVSYCDALSVALMREFKIQKIFAFDHHFEIMGVQLVRL